MPLSQKRTKLREGEVLSTGLATPLADGQWAAACKIVVRRGFDVRDVQLQVEGTTFDTEQDAISAGLRRAHAWVGAEFPLD